MRFLSHLLLIVEVAYLLLIFINGIECWLEGGGLIVNEEG